MFSTRILLNIGLAIILVTLIFIAVISNRENTSVSEFTPLQYSDINSIEIKHNKTLIKLNKTDQRWRITTPLEITADKFRVDAIISLLTLDSESSYAINDTDLKKYSLSPAKASLRLNQQEFLFGTTSSVNNKRYVLTQNKLFLIDDTIYPLITAGYKNIMHRRLLDSQSNITDIKSKDFHVYKNTSWKTDKQTISADALKKFVDNWKFIQAYTVNSAIVPYAGNPVYITTTDNKVIEFIINKNEFSTSIINPTLGLSYQFDLPAFDSLTQLNYYVTNEENN